MHKNLTTNPAV